MISTEMLASDVPDTNKVRAVMADKKDSKDAKKPGGKFKAAFMKKFGDKKDK